MNIAVVVVTYNRRELLRRCLDALLVQSRAPDRIYVIDNASTDGTSEFLAAGSYLRRADLSYVRLGENIGGAGGFSEGIRRATADGADWVWLMDDDATPEQGALAALVAGGLHEDCCYGSCAVFENDRGEAYLCWPAVAAGTVPGERLSRRVRSHCELPEQMEVTGIPFLGFLVNRRMVQAAGVPDGGYFVSGDDMDYGERLKKAGARLILVKASRIHHPRPNDYTIRFIGRDFFCLRMAPWRRYYDIRNRVINARRHYGAGLVFMTLPGIAVRWAATMLREPERLRQSRAYLRGSLDGLRGRLGRRWEPGA